MCTDFYNTNTHPITGFKKEQERQLDNYKGREPLPNHKFDESIHIYSKNAMKLTGERAKNLKRKIRLNGGGVFCHLSRTVYLIEDVKMLIKNK